MKRRPTQYLCCVQAVLNLTEGEGGVTAEDGVLDRADFRRKLLYILVHILNREQCYLRSHRFFLLDF
jgi:hypothetical protein